MARGVCSDAEKEKERARKISRARKIRKKKDGYLNSPATRKAISKAQRGKKLSELHKEKIASALKGRTPKNLAAFLAAAHASPKPRGPERSDWKGDAVSYSGLHAWVRRELGTPQKCSNCGTIEAKQFEWANKSGKYKRDLGDWIRLCTSCHQKMDRAKLIANGWKPWNKGRKIRTNTGRTHIKKGQRISSATEFKKGMTPHNKRRIEVKET